MKADGIGTGQGACRSTRSARNTAYANDDPREPPATARTMLSGSNWRTSRGRSAPSAVRIGAPGAGRWRARGAGWRRWRSDEKHESRRPEQHHQRLLQGPTTASRREVISSRDSCRPAGWAWRSTTAIATVSRAARALSAPPAQAADHGQPMVARCCVSSRREDSGIHMSVRSCRRISNAGGITPMIGTASCRSSAMSRARLATHVAPAPVRVAEDDDVGPSRLILVRREGSPERRLGTDTLNSAAARAPTEPYDLVASRTFRPDRYTPPAPRTTAPAGASHGSPDRHRNLIVGPSEVTLRGRVRRSGSRRESELHSSTARTTLKMAVFAPDAERRDRTSR